MVKWIQFSRTDSLRLCETRHQQQSVQIKSIIFNGMFGMVCFTQNNAPMYLQTPLRLPEFFLIGQWGLLYKLSKLHCALEIAPLRTQYVMGIAHTVGHVPEYKKV